MRRNGSEHAPIAWEQARTRLAAAEALAAEALRPSPARARALLEQRARELARPLPRAARPGELLGVTIFALATERYALETRLVREVVRFADFTPLPGAPDFLVGVTNLRGEILPVVDLRRFFALPPRGLTDQSRVLVMGREGHELGVLADAAHDVVDLRADEVQAPTAAATGIGHDYVRGVTREALVVLDGERLLRDPRLVIDMRDEAEDRSRRPE